MGPKRFGPKGQLAFSFGNVAQDEGSAMAQYAYAKGWRSASLATDTVIVYFKDVVKAFKARFTQLGGKIVAQESYQSLGSTSQQNLVTRLNDKKADVIVTATAGSFGALPQIVSGLRSLGNQTAAPQLVGRGRNVLGDEGAAGDELLLRHVGVCFR